MFVAYVVVASVVSVGLLGSAAGKFTQQPPVVKGIGGLGVPLSWFWKLAAVEVAGAVGLLAGIWIPAIGVAAAIGLIVYFVLALATHVRARDTMVLLPLGFFAGSVAALLLRLLSQ